MGQIVHPALGPQPGDVAGHQLVVLGVGSQGQAGLGNLLQGPHQLGVVGAGQAVKLAVPALGGVVQEGLVGHDALMAQGLDGLGVLAAGGAEEAEVHAAALLVAVVGLALLALADLQPALQDLPVPLGGHGDGMLKEGGASAGSGGPGAHFEGLPLPVAGVTVMYMGIHTAGQHMLAGSIDGAGGLGQAAGLGDQGEFPVLDAHVGFAESPFNEYKSVDNSKIQHDLILLKFRALPVFFFLGLPAHKAAGGFPGPAAGTGGVFPAGFGAGAGVQKFFLQAS